MALSKHITPNGIRAAAAAAAINKLRWFRPTAPQRRFMEWLPLRAQLRGPNQAGKTECLAALLADFVLKRGRWTKAWTDKWPGQAMNVWVICFSWKQSKVVQAKVYDLFPKDQLKPGTKYSKRIGFAGAAFETKDGAIISFFTSNQETGNLASATLHAVFIDEPPTEDQWGELSQRVKHHGGPMWLFYSPLNRPVEWLRAKVEKGEIDEVHFDLRLENVWPIGALVPFQTQAKIEQAIADCPVFLRPQRIEAKWDGTTEDRWCSAFDDSRHVVNESVLWAAIGAGGPDWKCAVGMDYGTQGGKMAAALVFVRDPLGPDPDIWFVDTAQAQESEVWEPSDLAAAIHAMLDRNGVEYHEVDLWIGDRSVDARRARRRVDNRSMYYALQHEYKLPLTKCKRVDQPKKDAFSLPATIGKLNGRFAKDRAHVVSRCTRLISFFAHFKGDPHDKFKDVGDAARYAALGLMGVRRHAQFEVATQ